MRRVALFYLIVVCIFFGCKHNDKETYIQRHGMMVGNVAGPFFHYGQAGLSETRHFELGNIPEEVNKITGSIFFSNPGNGQLIIKSVDSPYTCFAGWNGDKEAAPSQIGVIYVYFDKNKIESGPASVFVRIYTNDPSSSEVKIYFDFNVVRSPEQEDIHLLQKEVQSIKNDLRLLRIEIQKLSAAKNTNANKKALRESNPDTNIYDVTIGSSPVFGPNSAPVTIVEYFDFQCPFCAKEYQKIKQIMAEYPDKIRLILKHFPLDFHKKAPAAHAAVEFAFKQKGADAFWKMHNMIMDEPEKLDIPVLKEYAQKLSLDVNELEKIWTDDKAIAELLKADKELASKCNVHGTPTIFINGRKLIDRSLDSYRNQIKKILALKSNFAPIAKPNK